MHNFEAVLPPTDSDLAGQVLAIFVITVAAAEAAIGLGLIIALVRLKDTVALDEADVMRG